MGGGTLGGLNSNGGLEIHIEDFHFGSRQHTALFDVRHPLYFEYGPIINSSSIYTFLLKTWRSVISSFPWTARFTLPAPVLFRHAKQGACNRPILDPILESGQVAISLKQRELLTGRALLVLGTTSISYLQSSMQDVLHCMRLCRHIVTRLGNNKYLVPSKLDAGCFALHEAFSAYRSSAEGD